MCVVRVCIVAVLLMRVVFKRAQDNDERSGALPVIFMHQMERHPSQVNGRSPPAEIHPVFPLGSTSGGSAHSALM